MKRIYFALSLGLLLFVTSCIGKSDKKEADKPNQLTGRSAPEIVANLTQDYLTMDDSQPAINAAIENGGLWLTFHKDHIIPIGVVDESSYRLPDGPIKVEGLKGAPKNFIIADIGQDYNPILCVLTDQGKVQMLSLWDVIETGDMEATEIPMDGIVGFKDGPGGPWEDEDGSVFYDYTTIYAIDKRGNEQEIPLFNLDNNLENITRIKGTDVVYQLYLGSDWKMRYVVGYYRSEKVEELQGRFWTISEDWDNMVFRFGCELTTRMEYTGESVNTTAVNRTGVFEMQYPDFNKRIYIITPIEGVDFAKKGMNEQVPFNAGSAYGG